MDDKTYLELTEAEIKQRAKLTPVEQMRVDAFINAALNLPKSICIKIFDHGGREPHLRVSKRITCGSCQQVASLRKKSLCF